VSGIPDVLYVDHGCDFTSNHLDQLAASLKFRIVYSAVARPQGRGKIERLFGTLNSELLPDLPGHLVKGKPTSAPKLSLAELDRAVTAYITNTYHVRVHSETGQTPLDAWRGKGFLPRLPETLEELDLLLVMHAKSRNVRRDGIHFQGLRYQHPTMAGYVGDGVTIRYDPRDLSEIRVFYHNNFLCRAVSEEHAGEVVTLIPCTDAFGIKHWKKPLPQGATAHCTPDKGPITRTIEVPRSPPCGDAGPPAPATRLPAAMPHPVLARRRRLRGSPPRRRGHSSY
jgi:putative transposase